MAFTPLGQQPAPQAPEPQSKGFLGNAVDTAKNLSTGVAKGELSTVQGLGQLVLKGTDALGITQNKSKSTFMSDPTALQPKNTAETVGKTGEQIGEFFLPASKVSKAENVITALSQGLPKYLGGATRIAAKAGVNALADTAVGSAQTGDLGKGAEIGALGGAARGTMGLAGEAARVTRLPERLYQTVFKNSSRDMMSEFKTDYLVDLYKTRPHVFNDLAEQGIIHTDGGIPVLNKTNAEEALSRGLKGSITTMGKQVAGDVLHNESNVRAIAKNYKGTVGLEQPEFFNILREISSEYKNVGFGKISNEADSLAHTWLDSKGQVDGNTALAIRRLIDKARLARSFDVPVTKMSMTQANLKTLADEARKRLNKIPGMQSVMDEYSFNMDALEDLAKEGKTRGNNQLFSLIDSVFLGGGVGSGNAPAGLTLMGLRKYIQSGRGATTVGSALKNPDAGAKTVGAIGAGASLLEGGGQSPQQPQSTGQQQSFTPL